MIVVVVSLLVSMAVAQAEQFTALKGLPATPMLKQEMADTKGKAAFDLSRLGQSVAVGGGVTVYGGSSNGKPFTAFGSWNTGSSVGSAVVTFPR